MAASSHDKSRPISISVMDYIPMSGWEGIFFMCFGWKEAKIGSYED